MVFISVGVNVFVPFAGTTNGVFGGYVDGVTTLTVVDGVTCCTDKVRYTFCTCDDVLVKVMLKYFPGSLT